MLRRLMTVSWTTAQNPPPQYVQVRTSSELMPYAYCRGVQQNEVPYSLAWA